MLIYCASATGALTAAEPSFLTVPGSILLLQLKETKANINIMAPIAKVVIPVQTGIQKFLQHIEKTGFPLSWE
jgi:hypothetical protein